MLERLEKAVRTVEDFPTPGISFKDITPILGDAELLRLAVNALVDPFRSENITKVVGIEARGFILGAMIADELGAGFVPVRKKGKLPYTTIRETYELEYGVDTIEMHIDAISEHDLVLIHDDVIATGGTAAATNRLVELSLGRVAGYAFLVELDALRGRDLLEDGIPVHSVLHF
jgi:adenine phosphoribosyltransferase